MEDDPTPCAWTLTLQIGSGTTLPSHEHSVHQIVYATSGVLKVAAGEQRWVIPSQRALLMPARTRHEIVTQTAARLTTMYVAPEMLHIDSPRVVGVRPLLRELIGYAASLGMLRQSAPEETRLLGVILDQLRLLPDAPLQLAFPSDPRARRVAEWLHRDPADERPVETLARDAGASKRTLERLFTAQTGLTVAQWRRHARLLEALSNLAAGESVANAAASVGYSSTSAFITSFKRALGATPAEYFAPDRSAD